MDKEAGLYGECIRSAISGDGSFAIQQADGIIVIQETALLSAGDSVEDNYPRRQPSAAISIAAGRDGR